MRTYVAWLLAFVMGGNLLIADSGRSPQDGQEIEFAVPGQGLVTLGVFDKAGKLVRLLHTLDDEDAFRIGDNGYITEWDGRDDAGHKLPAGRYFLKGYLVGDVSVEGEAFHFNDWVSSAESPAPRRIENFAFLPDGDLLIAGFLKGGKGFCARYSNERGFLWSREFAPSAPVAGMALAATNQAAVVFQNGWHSFVLGDGSDANIPVAVSKACPFAISGHSDLVLFSMDNAVKSVSPAGEMSTVAAPQNFTGLAANGSAIAGLAGGNVWIQQKTGHFDKMPLPASVTSLDFGEGRTLWFTGDSMDPDALPVVAQVNFDGVILRALVPKPDEPRPVLVRASRTKDVFAVLEDAPGLQRFRVLSRNPEGGWTVEWERSIQEAHDFGFAQDQVAANAPEVTQNAALRFRLDENPLTGKHEELDLQVFTSPQGVVLGTQDGLPLLTVSHSPDISRVAIHRGPEPDSLRLLQGNGAVVEEFLVQGLRHIMPLAAGEVEIPK